MAQGVHSDITRTKIMQTEMKKLSEDAVLLKADYNQNNWSIACIIETFPNKHGIVRTIKLRLGDAVGAEQHKLVQPIMKIVLLVESDSPTESDKNIAKLPGNFGGAR